MDNHLMPHDVVTAFYEPIKPVLFRKLHATFRERAFQALR
jgi:hypothetical protein